MAGCASWESKPRKVTGVEIHSRVELHPAAHSLFGLAVPGPQHILLINTCYHPEQSGHRQQFTSQTLTQANNKGHMRYPEYKAKGLQTGTGTGERGYKHLIGARLKGARMI